MYSANTCVPIKSNIPRLYPFASWDMARHDIPSIPAKNKDIHRYPKIPQFLFIRNESFPQHCQRGALASKDTVQVTFGTSSLVIS